MQFPPISRSVTVITANILTSYAKFETHSIHLSRKFPNRYLAPPNRETTYTAFVEVFPLY